MIDQNSITTPQSERLGAEPIDLHPLGSFHTSSPSPLLLSGANRNVIANTGNPASDFARSSRDKAYPAMISGPSRLFALTGGKNEAANTTDN
jgi:hypothetical protein